MTKKRRNSLETSIPLPVDMPALNQAQFYAIIGVPVSTSQAIVGAVLGIGIALGTRSINNRTLLNIVIGWIATPLIAGILAFVMMKILFMLL